VVTFWIVQVGIDSFAAAYDGTSLAVSSSDRLRNLIDEIEYADQLGLDSFGIGEHHRRDYLESAPAVILGAAAARTQRIRLASAVTVLSSADPVRLFQDFATVDLLSRGRAEMVVGRGSFTDSFPLFGLQLRDYDALFEEKLDLLLKIRESEHVTWSGKFRAPLTGQGVYPRPVQSRLPIWVGVAGTPQSFARAGALGLPLMIAIVGGEPRRFRTLVDVYREAGRKAGWLPEQLKVGVRAVGYVAATATEATNEGPEGALLVGDAEDVLLKIIRLNVALGGISRITFRMNARSLPHAKLMSGIETIATRIAPALRKRFNREPK
jgi:alkanesulfonate monooxygenase SsuD/methylene tetrahydromethanopterin reductase-like flavin-dependent oxidoreductase (luciferase family)